MKITRGQLKRLIENIVFEARPADPESFGPDSSRPGTISAPEVDGESEQEPEDSGLETDEESIDMGFEGHVQDFVTRSIRAARRRADESVHEKHILDAINAITDTAARFYSDPAKAALELSRMYLEVLSRNSPKFEQQIHQATTHREMGQVLKHILRSPDSRFGWGDHILMSRQMSHNLSLRFWRIGMTNWDRRKTELETS